jgi:putative ABC transport system permease protein
MELDKELQFHIDELIRDNIAAGMSPGQARREALITLGGREQIVAESRSVRRVPWFDEFIQDVRFGWRMLAKNPGYTAAAILALSLGIGPNTALFTLFDNVALRPVPVPLPDRIAGLSRSLPQFPYPVPFFTYDEYLYYRAHTTVFEDLSANTPSHLRMSSGSSAVLQSGTQKALGLFVSSSYFSVMRVDPVRGNAFGPADDNLTAPPYPAVLSDNFWEHRFGRDPGMLGKTVAFNGIPAVIAGIMPRDFMGARPQVPDVWLPLTARGSPQHLEQERAPSYVVEGRLKPGISMPQAETELTQLAAGLAAESGKPELTTTIHVSRAQQGFQQPDKGGRLYVLYGLFQPAVGMVLLIACANVAGLLLGKAVSRQKEIAVRLSLGATRKRLIRQLLTEGFLIAQFAGLLSLLMTWWILKVLVRVALAAVENSDLSDGGTFLITITPDVRVFIYSFGISVVTSVAFALIPALQTTRLQLTGALNEEGPVLGEGGRSRFHTWTLAIQIAVCLMLLIGAATFVRSSRRVAATDPGFNTAHILTVSIMNPAQLGYSTSRIEALIHDVQSRLPGLPGVTSVSTASRIPLSGGVSRVSVTPKEHPNVDPRPQFQPRYPFTFVSTGYFETLGIPVLQGRSFTAQDISNHAAVAMISDVLAQKLWPGDDPIGKLITVGSQEQLSVPLRQEPFFPSMRVIGVVRNVYSDNMASPDPGALYLPTQQLAGWEPNLIIRTDKDPAFAVQLFSSELQAIDSNLSAAFQTMSSVLEHDPVFIILRVLGIVFFSIGLLGLVLASLGIYSMVGYAVSRQTREIGVRMALGAQKTDVLGLILRRSMRPVGIGVAGGVLSGVIVSLLMSRVSQALTVLDVPTLAGISMLLVVLGLLAAYVPARHATRLDPSVALRSQ